MERYSDLFPKEARKQIGNINLMPDGDAKEALINKLDSYIPYSRWMTYATENEMYDPTVAGRSRPEVDLLMAFLKDEVKFPGMKGMIAEREKVKENKVSVDSGNEEEERIKQEIEALRKIKDQKKNELAVEGKNTYKKPSIEEKQGFFGELIDAFKPSTLLKKSDQAEEQEKYKLLREQNNYSGRSGVGQDQIAEPIVKAELPDSNIAHTNSEKIGLLASHYGIQPLGVVITSGPNVDENGEELDPIAYVSAWASRVKDTIKYKIANDVPLFTNDTGDIIYDGKSKKPESKEANELVKNAAKKEEMLANLKIRQSGKGPSELQGAYNKVAAATHEFIAWAEAKLNPVDEFTTNYSGPGGLDYIDRAANNLLSTSNQKTTSSDVSNTNAVEFNAIKAGMITSSPTLKINPADLNPKERKVQAYSHTLKHEDPDLTGRIIDDKKRAILGGSVDAWGIVGGDIELGREVIMDVLKIKDSAKMKAFLQYFNAKKLDEHLGHIKKGKPALTSAQIARRKALKITPDQTKALVKWAYDNNLKTLTNSHGFLSKEVLENNPSLHQLLGDMAYRHGGSFMVTPSAGYSGLANAINHALVPTKEFSRADAIKEMNRLLFKRGTYSEKNEQGNARYAFLQDRFNRFKQNVTRANVAATPDPYGGMTLLNSKPIYKKNINIFNANPDFVNANNLGLPDFRLTGTGN